MHRIATEVEIVTDEHVYTVVGALVWDAIHTPEQNHGQPANDRVEIESVECDGCAVDRATFLAEHGAVAGEQISARVESLVA